MLSWQQVVSFFSFIHCKSLNTCIDILVVLLSMACNCCELEFQANVWRPDFPNIHRWCQSETQLFYVIFRVLVYAIRMFLNKIVLYMTDVRISKFTRTSFIKEAAINDVEHPGQFTVGDGCIKWRKVVSFDANNVSKVEPLCGWIFT